MTVEMDIVLRLRLYAIAYRASNQDKRADALEQAADEIDRLRNLLAEAER